MRTLALVALFLLLGGCTQPTAPPTPTSAFHAPPPVVRLTVRVVDPDGLPLQGAEVYVVPKDEVSSDPLKLPMPRATDRDGQAKLAFAQATDVVVQAFGPGKSSDWTREGVRLTVGNNISADRDLPILDRTVTITLYRSQASFATHATWSGARATLGPDGKTVAAALFVPVALDTRYAARLSSARATLSWNNSATDFGDLYAGLSYAGAETRGTDELQSPGPGHASENVAASWNPVTGGQFSAAAYTGTGIVGSLDLTWSGTLRFGGVYPQELPAPSCLGAETCVGWPLA